MISGQSGSRLLEDILNKEKAANKYLTELSRETATMKRWPQPIENILRPPQGH